MKGNHERAFQDAPEIYAAWVSLNTAIKARMDLRRYELTTFAAAQALRSSYCSLAHGAVLSERLDLSPRLLALDRRQAGLDEQELAVMRFAEKVVCDATAIDEADRRELRELGLDDAEIMDVVLAASARCFFSKTLDALDVRPDAFYLELDQATRDALVVGRPIAEPEA